MADTSTVGMPPRLWPVRTSVKQGPACVLPRTLLPRRWVNKLSEAATPRSLARHRSLYRARKASLKVQDAHLFRPNGNADHSGGHLAYPPHPCLPLFCAEVPLCAGRILRSDPLYGLDNGRTPDEQGMVGPLVAIDRQRDFGVGGQHIHHRRVRRGAERDGFAIPMEPNRYYTRCPSRQVYASRARLVQWSRE
jgi:hypothetical protein